MNKKVVQDEEHKDEEGNDKNKENTLLFSISELLHSNLGTSDNYNLDISVDLDDPLINPVSNLKANLKIISLHKEFTAQLTDVELEVESTCDKCLDKFVQKIEIPHIEVQFLVEPSKDVQFQEDIFHINRKNQSIDLTEWLRQEIILHFPLISVCSEHK